MTMQEKDTRNFSVRCKMTTLTLSVMKNGRRQGYQILGSNIADILHSQCDEAEWYGDGYNIRGRMIHHDGTNYVLYRIAKDRDEAERIAAKIYSGEIDEEGFRWRTRSLYPYVADVYGWKTRNRKKSA